MEPCKWQINIGSGNGLVPSGNKPLPEPLLIQIYITIWCHNATVSLSVLIKIWICTHLPTCCSSPTLAHWSPSLLLPIWNKSHCQRLWHLISCDKWSGPQVKYSKTSDWYQKHDDKTPLCPLRYYWYCMQISPNQLHQKSKNTELWWHFIL